MPSFSTRKSISEETQSPNDATMTRRPICIQKLLLLWLIVAGIHGSALSQPVQAATGLEQASFTLDGVAFSLWSPFIPGAFTASNNEDLIQMATADQLDPYQEISLTAIPYGTRPFTEDLPLAQAGIADTYRQLLQQERIQAGGTVVSGPTGTLLEKPIPSIASVVNLSITPGKTRAVLIVEWVFEGGERVWLLRVNQLFNNASSLQEQFESLSQVRLSAANIGVPSASLAFQEAYLNTPLPPTVPEPPIGALADGDLPFPGWWDGECDLHYYQPRSGKASYPLGASYRGVKACGPRPYGDGVKDVVVYFFPGAHGELEWQCVELSMRYMYLAYGVKPYPGNGLNVVNNYSGTKLIKIANDTVGQAPLPGDVLSYGTTGVGHTSVVMASNVDANGNGTVTILEQNSSLNGTKVLDVIDWHVYASTRITGWLHQPSTVSNITLNKNTILENQPGGTRVGAFSSTSDDPATTYTYTLVNGEGSQENIFFKIAGNKLNTFVPFNHEVYDQYRIRVKSVSSSGGSLEKPFIIQSINVNEAPTGITISPASFAENTPIGTAVGALQTMDEDLDDSHTYTFVSGTGAQHNALFLIQNDWLVTNANFDYEAGDTYSIRIKTTDSGGLSKTAILTITLTDQNEAPTNLILSNHAMDEDVPLGTSIGVFSTIDPDAADSHTYILVAGEGSADNAKFAISGTALVSNARYNYHAQPQHHIRVRTTDTGGLFFEKTYIINVLDINLPPTNLTLSGAGIEENQPSGTRVGVLSTLDPDPDDTHIYQLVSGAGSDDNAAFHIAGDQILSAQSFNFEVKNNLTIRVRTTDNSGAFLEKAFAISVTDVNEAPTQLNLSKNTVRENLSIGTQVGVFSMVDEDLGEVHTFQFISGEGDTNNNSFQISGSSLLTRVVFNYEQKTRYSIRVRGRDRGNIPLERVFEIQIQNSNDPPTNLLLSNQTLPENQPAGTVIGVFTSVDEDQGDTHSYQLTAGSGDQDNKQFAIAGGKLKTNAVLNYEVQHEYHIRVSTTDKGGAIFAKRFTIMLLNVNDAPLNLSLSHSEVTEHQPISTLVGAFAVEDEDEGDLHTFLLVAGTGDSGNQAFAIFGNLLRTNADLDFDLNPSHTIRVRATDAVGLYTEKNFIITVLDANQKPSDLFLSRVTIEENKPAGTAVGRLTTADPNTDDAHTYTLVEGDGAAANGCFHIEQDVLVIDEDTDFETRFSYPIRIRTTDREGLYLEKPFVITVTNLSEPPTDLALDNTLLDENSPLGTVVGMFSTEDEDIDDSHTYTLARGSGDTDNYQFAIVSNTLVTQCSPDFETKTNYHIRVRSTDSSRLFIEKNFMITVRDVNEIPESLTLNGSEISENIPPGYIIGIFSTVDPDLSDSHTYQLVEGVGSEGNGYFSIDNDQLINIVAFDYETQTEYPIRVRTTDRGGLLIEETYTITILPVNEYPPTAIELSANTIPENFPLGTLVGILSAIDLDEGDLHLYALVGGNGDSDNHLFQIDSDHLVSKVMFDYERQSEFSIRIRTTDSGGLSVEQAFRIEVEDRLEIFLPLVISQPITPAN